ncbi:hypothetical protein Fmac_032539 [Flemingia macrophylla]|uniref:Inositol polyphosphate-related phosphatase domain-containing protein n=1 Tax=Flemingia macrophylla TaxID=520843 RepID=A0ABD1L5L9_9FABA
MGFIHNQASPSHVGIRSVGVDEICNFSTTSDLCISIVTWNMNGQVTFEDLAEMVGSNRDFELLVVGLQEAPACPRNKVATMLSAALEESHTSKQPSPCSSPPYSSPVTLTSTVSGESGVGKGCRRREGERARPRVKAEAREVEVVGEVRWREGGGGGERRGREGEAEGEWGFRLRRGGGGWGWLAGGWAAREGGWVVRGGKVVMQSLQLYLFGPKNARSFINEMKVDKQSVGGYGGIIGRKKGAVAIRINYKGIRMVFISCHLSAHARNVEERNSQCRHLSHSLFSKFWNPYSRPSHITIWLGDLNYRLQGIDSYPARTLIEKNLHRRLHSKDQLLQEAGRGQIFNGFCEGTLTFKPTYKYNNGSSNYDTSHKVRVPAWTDRILFKIEDENKMEATLHSYESMDEIYGSDHKPVKAHLCLRFCQIPKDPSCSE